MARLSMPATHRRRSMILGVRWARLLAIDARLERVDGVEHLIIQRMEGYTGLLVGYESSEPGFPLSRGARRQLAGTLPSEP